ncbi:Proteinaceous RNase P 1, chloroplastic/mitochondrial [Vitis vinifera]|uniref:Proteinaceous RNase P 1, chloroplastic/mitochondrial n=1 Tax=Vitis vinifera TaxID=29760 RepID=A0A438H258_VITVI|nr:Proteinaceous RNase P 1, chloroplastic/mitochondrial [Vitis vinifera]
MSNKARKKARRESPEGVLRFKLDMCSKRGDVVEALRLYDEARSLGVPLSQHNYNQMGVDGIEPNEATFTSAARLACAMEDPEMAFNLVKQMKSCGIPPS